MIKCRSANTRRDGIFWNTSIFYFYAIDHVVTDIFNIDIFVGVTIVAIYANTISGMLMNLVHWLIHFIVVIVSS